MGMFEGLEADTLHSTLRVVITSSKFRTEW